MKAAVIEKWIEPKDLKLIETEKPTPGPGQALVQVEYTPLNFSDSLRIANKYHVPPKLPFIVGQEFSGTIESIGPATGDAPAGEWKVGDKVFAHINEGAYAEYALAPLKALNRIPEGATMEEAASFSNAYRTAHVGLAYRGRLKAGETVLVLGAAGGVGLAAVQLAKALGASKVIGVAGSDWKCELIREQGADVAVNHTSEDFTEIVKKETDGRGVDVVFDVVGGELGERAMTCMAPEGRLLIVGFASGAMPHISPRRLLSGILSVHGVSRLQLPDVERDRLWREMYDLFAAGKLKPYISRRFPAAKIAEALGFLLSRKSAGKVLLEWK